MRPDEVIDQAAGLRRMLGEHTDFRAVGVFGPDPANNALAAASLACALRWRGGEVWVLDEAPGPRNVAGQLGLTPVVGLADAARAGQGLAEVLATGPGGVRVLPARQAVEWAAGLDEPGWRRLGDDFIDLSPQWLILAAPADDRPSLALTAPHRLLVVPSVKSRLTEAYVAMKAVHQRQPDGQWHLLMMDAADAGKAMRLAAALADTARRFLGVVPDYFGAVPHDEKLDQASRAMRPILEVSPTSPAAAAFRGLAETMQVWPEAGPALGVDAYWQRMGLFSRMIAPNRETRTEYGQRRRAHG